MMKTITKLLGATIASLSLVALPATAQQSRAADPLGLSSGEQIDLEQLKCWDVVTVNEDDRGFAMVLLYGFARGKMDSSTFSPRDVQTAVVLTMQDCVDAPDKAVLDVLMGHISIGESDASEPATSDS